MSTALTLPATVQHHSLRTEADTLAFGATLARGLLPLLASRERAFIVTLAGPLGAGKTTLVRGLLAELGVTGAVRSPSYALMEHYATPHCQALHLDLYRLAAAEEFEGLGLRDYDLPGALWLVEWPERAGRLLPAADLALRLQIADEAHEVSCSAGSEDGRRLLGQGLTSA